MAKFFMMWYLNPDYQFICLSLTLTVLLFYGAYKIGTFLYDLFTKDRWEDKY